MRDSITSKSMCVHIIQFSSVFPHSYQAFVKLDESIIYIFQCLQCLKESPVKSGVFPDLPGLSFKHCSLGNWEETINQLVQTVTWNSVVIYYDWK